VVPASACRKAGHQNGEDLEFRVSRDVITILRKRPKVDDEYTPEQRRIIDARLAKANADIRAGRVSKLFQITASLLPICTMKSPSSLPGKPNAWPNETPADLLFRASLR